MATILHDNHDSHASHDPKADDATPQEPLTWLQSALGAHSKRLVERARGLGERVTAASDQAIEQGFDAFESLTRLTRDNLASGRAIAKEWRELGAETLRRQAAMITPSWLR